MKIRESGREGMDLPAREGRMQGEVEGARLLDEFSHTAKPLPRMVNSQGGSCWKVKRSIQNAGIHFTLSP